MPGQTAKICHENFYGKNNETIRNKNAIDFIFLHTVSQYIIYISLLVFKNYLTFYKMVP